MHGLPDDMVDAVLAQLKAAKISIDLKAITTPTNLEWNAMQMYAELRRERENFLPIENKQNASGIPAGICLHKITRKVCKICKNDVSYHLIT